MRRTQLRLLQYGFLSSALERYAVSGARHGIEYRRPRRDAGPRLLERLDPERYRARLRNAPIGRALHVLDF